MLASFPLEKSVLKWHFPSTSQISLRSHFIILCFIYLHLNGRKTCLTGFRSRGQKGNLNNMTEWLHFHFSLLCIGEGNGNPLHCSCLENPRDGVAQSRTQLKWLSSSINENVIYDGMGMRLQWPHLCPFPKISSVQSLSHVWLFASSWTAACQASLPITNSWNLLKLTFSESVMPSNHLILCCPLLLPSIFPSTRIFSFSLFYFILFLLVGQDLF